MLMLMFAVVLSWQLATVDELSWLAGCWSLARPDGVTEEQWLKPGGGTMMGVSRTIKGGKTVEHEFLQIRDLNGRLTLHREAVRTGRNRVPAEDRDRCGGRLREPDARLSAAHHLSTHGGWRDGADRGQHERQSARDGFRVQALPRLTAFAKASAVEAGQH